jgi:sugar O-acyltransferase (sialic acid O-acetyltransferase NeuD family)
MKTTAVKAPVVVYGASGHGKVVVDILRANNIEIEGFLDDDPLKSGEVFGLQILGNATWLTKQAAQVALGIGDNISRHKAAECCHATGASLITAIHPSATISTSATISPGTVIMPHAVINAGAKIGRGVIINTAAIVEHDCSIGDFAHLSPRVAIGGHAQVGNLAWLGIGSTMVPNRKIGNGSIIGAGATVIHDIDNWVVAVGTPARILKKLMPQN